MDTAQANRSPHLPGGNLFDDMRVDLAAAYAAQGERPAERRSVRRGRLRNAVAYGVLAAESRLGLHEALVGSGVRRAWFDEFAGYWGSLQGRPLTVMDFHALRFAYRTRAQHTAAFDWQSPEAHLGNWTGPENLAATFMLAYTAALAPVRSALLHRLLPKGGRVLEYGCSLAPMYRTWRQFHSHVPCEWTLADIPTFPFHYARHAYAHDAEASFVTITEERWDDPLRDAGTFDLIIVQEVFEHLHAPRRMAEYLLDRLNPGGLFTFDYIRKDDALGHDTPAGLGERLETLEYLSRELDIRHPACRARNGEPLCRHAAPGG